MIRPRYLPPNSCFDDPSARLDSPAIEEILSYAAFGEALHFIFDWIMEGEVSQRSLRFHLVVLCLWPQLLPCKRPSASWCGRIHGVSRQWACLLQQNFARAVGDKIQFRGQRFRKNPTAPSSSPVKADRHNVPRPAS
jgi:hypothetical protein